MQIDPRTTAFALTAFAQHHLMQQQQLQQLSTQPNQLQFLFQVIRTVLFFSLNYAEQFSHTVGPLDVRMLSDVLIHNSSPTYQWRSLYSMPITIRSKRRRKKPEYELNQVSTNRPE